MATLRLVQTLDREHFRAAVTVTIICERRGDKNVFSLPVTIRIMDVNDNAPQFLSSPYSVNISEMMMVGSQVMQVVALDQDQAGPFSMVEYSVVNTGEDDDIVRFDSPLDGKIVLNTALDYETVTKHEVVIRATDKGVPPMTSTTTLTIHVVDADDTNPVFIHDSYSALLPETKGTRLTISPADLEAMDQDLGHNSSVFYSFSSQHDPIYNYLQLNSQTGAVYLTGDPGEVKYLLPVTVLVTATQYDNPDRSTATSLTILNNNNITSPTIPVQFLEHEVEVTILESFPPGWYQVSTRDCS